MTEYRCAQILSAIANIHVLVVGDVMLDHFVWGRTTRISPEAPVPVVDLERESFMPGGAANVGCNLTSLGAKVALFGATGRDEAAKRLKKLLLECSVKVGSLIASACSQTSVKMRIIGGTTTDCAVGICQI